MSPPNLKTVSYIGERFACKSRLFLGKERTKSPLKASGKNNSGPSGPLYKKDKMSAIKDHGHTRHLSKTNFPIRSVSAPLTPRDHISVMLAHWEAYC